MPLPVPQSDGKSKRQALLNKDVHLRKPRVKLYISNNSNLQCRGLEKRKVGSYNFLTTKGGCLLVKLHGFFRFQSALYGQVGEMCVCVTEQCCKTGTLRSMSSSSSHMKCAVFPTACSPARSNPLADVDYFVERSFFRTWSDAKHRARSLLVVQTPLHAASRRPRDLTVALDL